MSYDIITGTSKEDLIINVEAFLLANADFEAVGNPVTMPNIGWIQAVVEQVIPAGAGTSNTLESTQVLVKDAVQAILAKIIAAPSTEAKQNTLNNLLDGKTNSVYGNSGAITVDTAVDVLAATGAGLKYKITNIIVTNSHADVGTLVTIRDEDGAVILEGYASAAGGGFVINANANNPIIAPTADKKLQAICETVGSNVYVFINAYKEA